MPDDVNGQNENDAAVGGEDVSGAAGGQSKSGMDEADVTRVVGAALRRLAPAITGIGVLLLCLELLIDAAAQPWRTVLIVVGILLAAGSWLVDLLRGGGGRRRSMLAVLVGVSVFFLVLGYVLRPIATRLNERLLVDCDDPVELSVLLPVDGSAGFQEAIAAFNDRYTDDHRCRKANVTAYSASWPEVERAMGLGWEPVAEGAEGDFQPLRDVGIRPHLWIAESQTQVDLAAAALDGSEVKYEVFAPDDAEPVGVTPLVLAVPDTVLDGGFNEGEPVAKRSLPELVTELGDVYGTPVLRSDPAVTHSGLLFLRALYGQDADPGGEGARLENRLADAAAATGIALSPSDTELLCDLVTAQGPNPTAAVLTTEAALARYNTGNSLGDECALTDSPRSGLVPVYGTGLGALDYQAVSLDWKDDAWAGRRAAVADDLRTWLAGEDSRWSPTDMGVRDGRYEGGGLAGDVGFEKSFPAEADPISAGEFRDLREVYGENRVPTDVLLAIDRSATMDEAGGGGESRFELAAEGAAAALGYLGAEDRVGLWTFPADGADSHVEVLAMSADPGDDAADGLFDTAVSHGVDLHQTVVDGIAELESAHEGNRLSAMVVLTDGADLDTSATTVAEVHERLADSQVSLYLIAVGEASCRSATFDELAGDARVTCLEAEEEQITMTFDNLFNQLWGGRG
ncbi:VWA domain-containing protein [Glycomyces paridis]|uniref:VWA domain-containing protein n=1 Tax=Glycomyces paridis TaxID=2126555 RepID=A0A4S8P0R8_9ACTN|nr:VWA domain-containing protein [Glycomyces paridis]THV23593.1 VWA domain-containing protein [Glycomyces paridis]